MKCKKEKHRKSKYNILYKDIDKYYSTKHKYENKCENRCESICNSCKSKYVCKRKNICDNVCYRIFNDIYYPDPELISCSNAGILMYDQNMVWNPIFKNIVPFLLYGTKFNVPDCKPYNAENIPSVPSTMNGLPLFDSLTDVTYMIFTYDGMGPVVNDPAFKAFLIYMYDNTPDLRFSYTVVPVDPTKPVTVSFYTITNIYEFDTEGFWLMLDRDSHFTTYSELSHTFQIPGIITWIATGDNVASMSLIVTAVPTFIIPPCGSDILTANVNIDCENQKVIIGKISTDPNPNTNINIPNISNTSNTSNKYHCKKLNNTMQSGGQFILDYCYDLRYSVDRMKNYIKSNSLGLLLPLIPADIPNIVSNNTPNVDIGINPITYTGLVYNKSNYYAITNNITPLKQQEPENTYGDKTDYAGGNYYGIVTSAYTNKYDYIQVSWSITYVPAPGQTNFAPAIQLYYSHSSKAYEHIRYVTYGSTVSSVQSYIGFPFGTTNLDYTVYLKNDCTDIMFYFSVYHGNSNENFIINSVTFAGWLGDPPNAT